MSDIELYSVNLFDTRTIYDREKNPVSLKLKQHFKNLGFNRLTCYKSLGFLIEYNKPSTHKKLRLIPPITIDFYKDPFNLDSLDSIKFSLDDDMDYNRTFTLYYGPIYSIKLPVAINKKRFTFGFILRDDYIAFLNRIGVDKKLYNEILEIIPKDEFIYLCSSGCEQFDKTHTGTICPITKPRSLQNFLYSVLIQRMLLFQNKKFFKGVTHAGFHGALFKNKSLINENSKHI